MWRSVHVSIGHDDDAVVAQVAHVEALADAGAQRGDQRLDLLVGQRLVQAGLFDVENLAAQGQNGLEAAVAALFGLPPALSPSTM
jgi:predicted component of type VI protein secretion system